MSQSLETALRGHWRVTAAPAELREQLLFAGRRQDRTGAARRLRRGLQLGLAASLLLVLGSGAAWLNGRTQTGSAAMAQAALSDFMASHHLEFEGQPPACAGPDACAQWAKGCVGFEAALPRSCGQLAVSGGRGCRVQGQKAACYQLLDGRSLYVFPGPLRGAGASQGQTLAVAANYQARAWNEDGKGYVMVATR